VIRAARRDPSRNRTVRLSRNAHEILRKLATREKLTLSEVIERYLSMA
jgi:predicted DNA-binding ribbon-helix-helix protein